MTIDTVSQKEPGFFDTYMPSGGGGNRGPPGTAASERDLEERDTKAPKRGSRGKESDGSGQPLRAKRNW